MRGVWAVILMVVLSVGVQPQSAVAAEPSLSDDTDEVVAATPDEGTVYISSSSLRRARMTALTSLAVATGSAAVAGTVLAVLGSVFAAILVMHRAGAVPPPISNVLLPASQGPLMLAWATVIGAAGAVAGAALGVGAAGFMELSEEDARGLWTFVLAPFGGLVAGGLAVALGVSSGVLLFFVFPDAFLRPVVSVRPAYAAPQVQVPWLMLVPAFVLSAAAGVMAVAVTHGFLGPAARAAAAE